MPQSLRLDLISEQDCGSLDSNWVWSTLFLLYPQHGYLHYWPDSFKTWGIGYHPTIHIRPHRALELRHILPDTVEYLHFRNQDFIYTPFLVVGVDRSTNLFDYGQVATQCLNSFLGKSFHIVKLKIK